MSTLRPVFAWTCIVFLTYALAGCATYEKCEIEGCPGVEWRVCSFKLDSRRYSPRHGVQPLARKSRLPSGMRV
jgi:hypothetical protein